MKKATRFTFTNNKETALSAPEKVKAARDSSSDSGDEGETYGKKKKFVAARSSNIAPNNLESQVVLGKRKRDASESSEEESKKKSKKSKKHKKDKKEKKEKKSKKDKSSKKASKRARKGEDAAAVDEDNDRNKDRAERWVPPERNPWTGRAFSDKFFDILQKRKELPAWQARQQVLDLVNEYQVMILQGETGSGKTT